MVASKLANMKSGTRTDLGLKDTRSTADAAKLLSVSEPSVKRAKQVVERGSKELVQAVEHDQVSLNQAVF
jgi:3-hydroxyisobutyrate dehydrogenase-like beta-hydroxyacid dehydrogenase